MRQSGTTIRRKSSRSGITPLNLLKKWRLAMNRTFIITAMLLLSPFPAFGQNDPGGDRREHRDVEDLLRGLGGYAREGLRSGGAAFFLRYGDAMVGVRCDPQDSVRSCVDATLTLLDRARSMQPSGAAPGGTPGGQPPSR
jgi:hypothetical protein